MVKLNKKNDDEVKKEPELAYQLKKIGNNFHIITIDINSGKIIDDQNIGFGFNETTFKVKKFFMELLNDLYDEK